ncbi:MAG: hypothetical protein NTNFB01_22360 [Nitrospira sp.]
MTVLKNHLCVQRKSAYFLGAREILDLLDCGEVGALTSLFHIWRAGGSPCEEDVFTEMKQGLFCPKWVILASFGG